MHPYASSQAPLLRPDPVFELRRTGRRVGLGAVLLAVAGSTALVARTIQPDSTFLLVHALSAFGALLPVGLLGGPYVAFQGAGGWLKWNRAVAQIASVSLLCAALGVLLGGSILACLGHPVPYGGFIPADPGGLLWLALGSVCLALTLSSLAGLILRSLAQAWVERFAPELEPITDETRPDR